MTKLKNVLSKKGFQKYPRVKPMVQKRILKHEFHQCSKRIDYQNRQILFKKK